MMKLLPSWTVGRDWSPGGEVWAETPMVSVATVLEIAAVQLYVGRVVGSLVVGKPDFGTAGASVARTAL